MRSFSLGLLGVLVSVALATGQSASAQAKLNWYRGNTHTHTLNSDGDAAPDVMVRWYREHEYQFVVITDHEFLTDVGPLQALFGADEQFLVMQGQEVTQIIADPSHPEEKRQAHLNAINASRVVMPIGEPQEKNPRIGRVAPAGTKIADTYARNLAAINAAGGVGQINHPNWRWSVSVEDMAQLPNGTLFELWNGIPEINNLGGTDDEGHVALSTEALWDTLLSRGKVLWGVGSDDSHDFYKPGDPLAARPGQAWVVVRAEKLSAAAITAALQRGDFYASTGVALEDYEVGAAKDAGTGKKEIVITLKRAGSDRDDTRFLTRFIGKGGRVLAEVPGLKARYAIRGNEGYVRASIVDSNSRRAWTQPVMVK